MSASLPGEAHARIAHVTPKSITASLGSTSHKNSRTDVEKAAFATSSAGGAVDGTAGANDPHTGLAASSRSASPLRWFMLLMGVVILIGPYVAFDSPAGTQVTMRGYFDSPVEPPNINSTIAYNNSYATFNANYGLLYTAYSLPNTVMPLFAGVLTDRLGYRPMTVATTFLALCGSVVVLWGVAVRSWPLMWAGRAVYGVGTESMCVAQRTLVSNWFLAVAMGATLAFGRIGSVISVNVSALFSSAHVPLAYAFACCACAVSLVAAMIASCLDWRWERRARDRAAAADIGAASNSVMQGGATADAADVGTGASVGGGGGGSSTSVPSSAAKRKLSMSSGGNSLRQLLAADTAPQVVSFEMTPSPSAVKGSINQPPAATARSAATGAAAACAAAGKSGPKIAIFRGPSRWWWRRDRDGSTGSGIAGRDLYGEADASRIPSTATEPGLGEPLLISHDSIVAAADVRGPGPAAGSAAASVAGARYEDWGGGRSKRSNTSVRSRVTFADDALRADADARSSCCGRWRRRLWRGVVAWCSTLRSFKVGFWLLCGISIAGFAPITTFNSYAIAQLRFRALAAGEEPDVQSLSAASGILYAVAAGTAPFMGALVDRARAHVELMMTAQALVAGVHVCLALLQQVSEVPFIAVLGLLFATFASSFWSSLAGYVPAAALGQAYGLVGAIQNMGLAASPYVAAQLQPPGCATFGCMEFFFAGCAGLAASLAAVLVVLRCRDRRRIAAAALKRLRAASLLTNAADADAGAGAIGELNDNDIEDAIAGLSADAGAMRRSIGCAADGVAFAAAAAAAAAAVADAASIRSRSGEIHVHRHYLLDHGHGDSSIGSYAGASAAYAAGVMGDSSAVPSGSSPI